MKQLTTKKFDKLPHDTSLTIDEHGFPANSVRVLIIWLGEWREAQAQAVSDTGFYWRTPVGTLLSTIDNRVYRKMPVVELGGGD